ncbi:hypothetical protein F5141DRAFT_430987 [Pisolithus sp. B1]|nr:hypothetical protein F5141DRAFT_430987 [Pisolithus sp. B1]
MAWPGGFSLGVLELVCAWTYSRTFDELEFVSLTTLHLSITAVDSRIRSSLQPIASADQSAHFQRLVLVSAGTCLLHVSGVSGCHDKLSSNIPGSNVQCMS